MTGHNARGLPAETLAEEIASAVTHGVAAAPGIACLALTIALVMLASGRASATPDNMTEETLLHDGLRRQYILQVPPGLASPVPLFVALHGGGGSGGSAAKHYGFDALADREGLIAVYPDALDRQWNDARTGSGSRAETENIDDVGFIAALIDKIVREYPVAGDRIYVTGFSNGGMMAQRLACELPDRFAAVAAIVSSMPIGLGARCRPGRPVPIMFMNGTADPVVPFNGGAVRVRRNAMGKVWSTARTVEFWRRNNACPDAPETAALPDRDPNDGTRIVIRRHAPCRKAADVVLYEVVGGGHTMPGTKRRRPRRVVGAVSGELDGAATVWQFLSRHRLAP